MDRRRAHLTRRRITHMALRHTGVIRQEWQSSSEGPDDSPKAQKAARAVKARRA